MKRDGFFIARADLEQRGPGDFFGDRQSGELVLRTASLTDMPLLEETGRAMEQILPHSLKTVFFDSVLAADRISPRMMKKTRFIPTSTVSGESLLCGFIPDSVTVDGAEKRACLALDKSAADFEGADAILPTVLLG